MAGKVALIVLLFSFLLVFSVMFYDWYDPLDHNEPNEPYESSAETDLTDEHAIPVQSFGR